MDSGNRLRVDVPSDLEERIERHRRRAGFDSSEEYVAFVLEQILRALETPEPERDRVESADSDDLRAKLEELGYL